MGYESASCLQVSKAHEESEPERMRCGLHADKKQRFVNGTCYYCRKADLQLLKDIEAEVYGKPQGPTLKQIVRGAVWKRQWTVAELKRKPISAKTPLMNPETDGVMSFDEIGHKLGVTHARAQQLCESGLKKLREIHPQACRQLLDLAIERRKCLGESHAS